MGSQAVEVKNTFTTETLNHGGKTVAAAGTAEALAVNTACYEVLIQVKRTNTGRIYVGGAAVPNDDSAGVVIPAPPAGTTPGAITLSARNLNEVFINSTVNGEGVTFIYW